jgi:YbbR domain-containing protein
MRSWQQLLSHLSSAFLALFLAIMVWVVAVYEEAPPHTDFLPSTVPIQRLDLAENLVITNAVPTEAKVKVRALSDTWDQLRPSDFEATVDLLGMESGQHDAPVVVTTLLEDVAIVDVQPDHITVNLEEVITRSIRVRVNVSDEETIPTGYQSGLPEVDPQEITIRGPKTTVERVSEAYAEVSVLDARDTVTEQVTPALLDTNGDRVRGLEASPERVTVRVVVERREGYRDVAVRAVVEGSPASGYWISNISVEPALVTVSGDKALIGELPGFVDTETIDIEGASNDVIKRVGLDLPEGVLPWGEGSGPEGLLVQISIEPQLGGRTVYDIPVEMRGLRLGLLAEPSPTSVDVILSGPLPELQELQPEEVQAILNLVGLDRGTHKVKPIIILPEGLGLQVKSIVPDIVEITIE